MKHVLLIFFMVLAFAGHLAAQATITGQVVEEGNEEPLIGATILVIGTTQGAITDIDGNFELSVPEAGDYTLEFSYTGYSSIQQDVYAEGNTNLGVVALQVASVGLQEVEVIASVAVDRKTPVAVSTLKGETVEALVGNQEYPEILRKTPSIYVTKQGGGFGDARINVRGFDSRNTAVMINGIPVNDMENGWVYWSNWAGLADVTSRLQVQRGLGASKLAVPSVGGSINIITDAAEMDKGGNVSVTVGNDGYQKYGLVLSSGLTKNGWAITLQGTHTRGNGYVDGTMFRAYSYFGSLSKVFNDKHTISATALGAPQWHHQRTVGTFDPVSLRSFVDPDNTGDALTDLGIRYNHNWGMLDGKEYNWRRNFYHKPKMFINHYWTISNRTELRTSAYMSFGRGGGTGPRGGVGGRFDTDPVFLNDEGTVRFDDIVNWNSGGQEPDFDQPFYDAEGEIVINPNGGRVGWDGSVYDENGMYDGRNVATENNVGMVYTSSGRDITSRSMGLVRRASMNSHNWYGVLSTLEHSFSNRLTLIAGVDGRYYKGIHYRRMNDLLGNEAFFTNTNVNNDGDFITQEKPADALVELKDDRKLNYYNDGLVGWLGLFGQLEYNTSHVSTFISFSGSNQGYKRVDYFNYLDSDSEQTTDWENFWGGTIKGGVNYRITNQHNVFVNAGYFSRQPLFDAVFINFVNDVNENVKNEKVTSFEAGYGFRSSWLTLNLNGYFTTWGDRQEDESLDLPNGNEGLAIFQDITQRHMGIELDFVLTPIPRLDIEGMVSIGDWVYTKDFVANVTDTDTGQPVDQDLTIYADGLMVGDAAQTTFSLGLNYRPVEGLGLYASYYYADRLFAPYNILESQFLSPGGQVAQVPNYSLVDAGLSYSFDLAGLGLTLRFNMNNVFNETYIAELVTNELDDPDTPENEFYDNQGWFGFGRTWNTGLKIRF